MTLTRQVVLISDDEYNAIQGNLIANTGMYYNPIQDSDNVWTISEEEVEMSAEPFLFLKELPLTQYKAPVVIPWF